MIDTTLITDFIVQFISKKRAKTKQILTKAISSSYMLHLH